MKKNLLAAVVAGFMAWISMTAANPIELKVWPDGEPNPVEFGFDEQYVAKNNLVKEPILIVFPAQKPNGLSVVACPGGGYGHLAKYHEGLDMADWFNAQGITYAVLLYRMPQGHDDVPLSDALQAIRIMRQHAQEWGITRVGIMGSSAGGHLASTAATHYTADSRPDFQILFYPVISLDPSITHMGTHDNLIGRNATKEIEDLYSNELQVTPDTPVAFILHSSDDGVVPVENTLRYFAALTANKVYSTMHIYPIGGHGWGFRDSFPFKPQWTSELSYWLTTLPR